VAFREDKFLGIIMVGGSAAFNDLRDVFFSPFPGCYFCFGFIQSKYVLVFSVGYGGDFFILSILSLPETVHNIYSGPIFIFVTKIRV